MPTGRLSRPPGFLGSTVRVVAVCLPTWVSRWTESVSAVAFSRSCQIVGVHKTWREETGL